jgi:micrococcal nuclease
LHGSPVDAPLTAFRLPRTRAVMHHLQPVVGDGTPPSPAATRRTRDRRVAPRHRPGRTDEVRRLTILIALVLGACGGDSPLATPVPTTAVPGPVDANATVEFVVDGDTVDVVVDGREERVRLTGIDTPELAHDASETRPATIGECFGEEARAFVTALLPVGTPVRLERDIVARDDYGRMLAYVYRAADGIFVNYEIVRQGYAQPLTIPPNVTFADLMVQAARDAEADDVGLWSACATPAR